jgi:nucleoside-diphosphate-sugar epimerase
MNRILITGANGYLGSALTSHLISSGYDVSILVRDSAIFTESLNLEKEKVYLVEKLKEYSSIQTTFDTIIHCATRYKADRGIDLAVSNISFPLNVIEAFLDNDGCFINIDSSLDPQTNLYAGTKYQFEKILKLLSDNTRLKVINLELEYFFDENEPENRFLHSLIRSCLENQNFNLTEGEQIRDFIHMSDLCSAVTKILQKKHTIPDAFTNVEIGSGKGISIKELANLVKKLSNSDSQLNFGTIPYRENETMIAKANTDFLRSLGWLRAYNLNTGLQQTIELIRSKYGK